jgi:hypothetical protein
MGSPKVKMVIIGAGLEHVFIKYKKTACDRRPVLAVN